MFRCLAVISSSLEMMFLVGLGRKKFYWNTLNNVFGNLDLHTVFGVK